MPNPDEELRNLLAQTDPVGPESRAGASLLDRVREEIAAEPTGAERQSWLHRHWQGSLLVAAAVASLALATPVLAPGLFTQATDQSGTSVPSAVGPVAEDSRTNAGAAQDGTGVKSEPEQTTVPAQQLVRSANLTVGTDDTEGRAAAFTSTIAALGGRVLSESVVTQPGVPGPTPLAADTSIAPYAGGIGLPYPYYPAGPGVYLTVEVPADRFEEAMQAARDTGEVVQLQQSAYDVGAQVADVNARIAALETSLQTLNGLLGKATSVSDVVALEAAISQRQSELDGLRAQQRSLANQTSMSQISLTLMSPDDARDAVYPQPPRTWWESFLDGLEQMWTWLGKALLITSPLLLALAVIWWVRRRRRSA